MYNRAVVRSFEEFRFEMSFQLCLRIGKNTTFVGVQRLIVINDLCENQTVNERSAITRLHGLF